MGTVDSGWVNDHQQCQDVMSGMCLVVGYLGLHRTSRGQREGGTGQFLKQSDKTEVHNGKGFIESNCI